MMPCCICGKVALYQVSVRGYCAAHKQEALNAKAKRGLTGLIKSEEGTQSLRESGLKRKQDKLDNVKGRGK